MTFRAHIEQAVAAFPAMPAFSQRLVTYLQDPDADFRKVTELVQYDPGLTANVLKLANSAAYGATRTVDSLRAAIPRLGTTKLLDMVLALTVSRRLLTVLPGYGLERDELLRHSVFTAVAAGELAGLLGMGHGERIFTIALMHDLGTLVLDPFVARHAAELDERTRLLGEPFERAERAVLGMDHAEAGAAVLDAWQLGGEVVAGVRWHHEPEGAGDHRETVYLIHLADLLALSQGIGTGSYGMYHRTSPQAVDGLGLKKRHLEYVSSVTLDRMNELTAIMG